MKLNECLVKCDDYLSTHWPKVLREYESQQAAEGHATAPNLDQVEVGSKPQKLSSLDKRLLGEAEYVDAVIQEAAILHVNRSGSAQININPRKLYPFEVDDDFIGDEFSSNNTC